ncbi:hypothetical protein [Paraburkholderia caledonica]|uniref:Uncharacterized protein n=1 Tax=Paraburkholderia caledonica TaxID=134536 RepID=A0AB73INB7_9BURK|nr:hypothetical protein [Paraburkholderia caledonica]
MRVYALPVAEPQPVTVFFHDGNFAAAVAQWARDERIGLHHQLLLFPITDISRESASYAAFDEG